MKKNDWLIAASALCFAVLFYRQSPGINFLLFSLLSGSVCIAINHTTLKRSWYLFFGLHLLTAWNIFFTNSTLSCFAWGISFIFTIGSSLHTENSTLLQVFSAMLSPVHAIGKLLGRFKLKSEQSARKKKLIYLASFIAALLLVLIFLGLYKGANPLFNKFTNAIDLSWINLPFILTVVFGFVIMLSLTNPFREERIAAWDSGKMTGVISFLESASGVGIFARSTGTFIFAGLNIMLLLLNILDVNYIFITQRLPEGISLSDFVHDSVAAIIFSIILAITIILLTRQFTEQSKIYRFLVYAWIGQSFVMLFHTFVRNSWYIKAYQMTHLRTGVFVFLTLAVLGLIYTAYVLHKNRTYWFLFHLNARTWFLTICLLSFINWDAVVTRYNISHKRPEKVDLDYLLGLDNNTALLVNFYRMHPLVFDRYQIAHLANEKRLLCWEVDHQSWQNFSLRKNMQYNALKTGKR